MPEFDPAFVQLGYVTDDIDAAIAHFARTAGVRDFLRWDGVDVEMERGGKPANAVLDLAFAWRGSTMIELIRPVSGDTDLYRTIGTPGAPLVLHHIGHGIPGDEAEFDARLAAETGRGNALAMLTRGHMGNYALIDTRAATGLYTEYLWSQPEGAELFAGLPRNEGIVPSERLVQDAPTQCL